MLPRATSERTQREVAKGRAAEPEIQRLIGRALRGVVDTSKLGDRTVTVDCDVLHRRRWHAHGVDHRRLRGPRAGAASGMERQLVGPGRGGSRRHRRRRHVLDLDYSEDSRAEVDFNVVGTDKGEYVEVQGTAEGKPFDRAVAWTAVASPTAAAQLFEAQAPASRRPTLSLDRVAGHGGSGRDPARRTSWASSRSCSICPTSSCVAWTTSASPGEPEETGATFEANAIIKARYTRRARACRRSPTTRARGRRAGRRPRRAHAPLRRPDATDEENNTKLLAELAAGCPPTERGARYVCVLASRCPAIGPARRPASRDPARDAVAAASRRRRGATAASATTRSSSPSPEPPGGRTLGQWSADEKNAISHRARAAGAWRPCCASRPLRDRGGTDGRRDCPRGGGARRTGRDPARRSRAHPACARGRGRRPRPGRAVLGNPGALRPMGGVFFFFFFFLGGGGFGRGEDSFFVDWWPRGGQPRRASPHGFTQQREPASSG